MGIEDIAGSIIDGLFGLGDTMLGSYYDKKAASRANQYALYARSTAHQVEVDDLKKAGLNPVLSALGSGGHGASYNAPSAVRSPNPAPVFSNAAKALTRAEVRKAQAEADSAESQAKVDEAESEVRKESLDEKLKQMRLDNTYRGDKWRLSLGKMEAERDRARYALEQLDPLERLKLQATFALLGSQNYRESQMAEKLAIENSLLDAEQAFLLGNPFLHNFRIMGGSAQQIGKLSDYTNQLFDLSKFLKSVKKGGKK